MRINTIKQSQPNFKAIKRIVLHDKTNPNDSWYVKTSEIEPLKTLVEEIEKSSVIGQIARRDNIDIHITKECYAGADHTITLDYSEATPQPTIYSNLETYNKHNVCTIPKEDDTKRVRLGEVCHRTSYPCIDYIYHLAHLINQDKFSPTNPILANVGKNENK